MPLVTRRRGVVLAAALTVGLAGVVPALTATSAQATITTAFGFNPGLTLLDANGANTGAAEPSLDVDTPGNVYVMGPAGVPTGGCPFWTVHPGTFNSKGLPYDYRGRPDLQPGGVGGGDCDISHGPRSTLTPNADSVAVSSLSLGNLTTTNSQDAGKTFRTPPNDVGGTQVFGVDRQWQGVDRSLKAYYLIVHDVATSNIQVSADTQTAGYQYLSNTPAISDPNALAAATMDNHFSPPVIDEKTHKIYIAYVAPATAQENAAFQAGTTGPNEHTVWVAVGDPCATTACTPGQAALGPISWNDYALYSAPTGQDLAHIFPIITIDRGDPSTGANKNVYIAWSGDTRSSATNRIQMLSFNVSAANPSTAFTKPIFVDDGSNHSNMFPWLVAGKKGVVDAAWYSGQLMGNGSTCPKGATGSPDDSNGVNNNCFNQWHVTFAQVTNAAGTTPVVTRSYASGINHRGSICDQGLNCSLFGGDRSLLDFFDMALDPAGGANIAYVQDPSQITYTRQCSGKSATTGLVLNRGCGPLAPTPPSGPTQICGTGTTHTATVVTDAAGDDSNPTGAGTNGSTDARSVVLANPSSGNVDVTISVSTLQSPVATPPPGTSDIYYYVTWTSPNGKQYAVEHVEPEAAKRYTFGQFDPSRNRFIKGTTTPITGSYNPGSPGTILWHVPTVLFGSPTIPAKTASSAALQKPYAVVIVGEGAGGTGLVFIQPADRAPNSGSGSTWSVC